MTRPMSAEDALADGFAQQLLAMAANAGTDADSLALLGTAARAVSHATSAGHVCMDLREVLATRDSPSLADARARLLDCGLVAAASSAALLPLVLDDEDRLYLARYYDYERRLAACLVERAKPLPGGLTTADQDLLAALFAANRQRLGDKPDWQKLACALAMRNRLTIIAGGPGTGKTTTVVNLLAALLTKEPHLRIALAAPTGKAAQRMREAIRERAGSLPDALQAQLPQDVYTLHRLLGVIPGSQRFRHDAGNPLAFDVLVVDEASMLDLALATKLLEAVPAGARLIVLGDKDQLAAVEAGAVFHEIGCDPTLGTRCTELLAEATGMTAERIETPSPQRPSPLRDSVVWLTESLRFGRDSGIGRLAEEIRNGEAEAVTARLVAGTDPGLHWVAEGGSHLPASSLRRLMAGLADYLEAVRSFEGDPGPVLAAFDRFRVLCAVRASERGVEHVNRLLSSAFRQALRHDSDDGRTLWYPGRPVIILRNDYGLGLFNGDIGLTLPDPDGRLFTHFPTTGERFLTLTPARLPPHETAFALTVHKSQGSEFDEVAVILPAHASRVMTKELIYTAVTRARSTVTLYGSDEVLAQAIRTPTVRRSGLIARLREQALRTGNVDQDDN